MVRVERRDLGARGADVRDARRKVQLDNASIGNALDNLETITPAGALTIRNGPSITTAGPVANAGSVTVGTGSTLTTTGAYTQTAGRTTLEAGTGRPDRGWFDVDVQGGIFAGKGTVGPAVDAKATMAPGLSPGILSVAGPLTQTATSHLAIQIGGTTVGTQYDRLDVDGTAALAGTLDLSTINGFVPALGQTFTVLTATSRSGTFANVTGLYAGGGRQYAVSYTPTAVVVTVVAGPAGPDLVVATAPTTSPFVPGRTGRAGGHGDQRRRRGDQRDDHRIRDPRIRADLRVGLGERLVVHRVGIQRDRAPAPPRWPRAPPRRPSRST